MLTSNLLALTLALPLTVPQDEDPKGPSREEVEATVQKLEAAFGKKEVEEISTALQSVRLVTHPDVIEVFVDEGLAHRNGDIRRASIEALGSLRHAESLAALHKHYKRKKKALAKEPQQLTVLLKAIALHGDLTSIDLLADDVFSSRSPEVIKARILSLGKIRSAESVKQIFDLMKKVDRRKVQPRMQDIRVALVVLTHVDQGTSQDRWLSWWNENKKAYELPAQTPKLPKDLANSWGRYWGYQRQYDRQKRRDDRGNDPEDDGGEP